MKKKNYIIIGICVLVLIVGLVAYKTATPENRLKIFEIDRPDFSSTFLVAVGQRLDRVDVFGKVEDKNSEDIKIGTMELVEGNDQGEQSWTLALPKDPLPVIEVYALGFDTENKQVGKLTLPYKGKEQIQATLWPAVPSPSISGIVKLISARQITLDVVAFSATSTIKVKVATDAKVFDVQGRVVPFTRIQKNMKITASGTYADEGTFNASRIDILN